MTTNTTSPTHVHPSTRGVHYLYLTDTKNRMVGCIATVRRGQDLFIGTSFCSGRNGDVFRKAQGRAIAEGRANRRAEEQDRIMQVFSSKSIDQTSDLVQFLTRAQHALRVNLDLLSDSTTTDERPNAFDVLKAILQSVIEFDNDLDDRNSSYYTDADSEIARDLGDSVADYFANLDLPGGLVRAARRKLNEVSNEAFKREVADTFDVVGAICEMTGLAMRTSEVARSFAPPGVFPPGSQWRSSTQPAGVLGPVVPTEPR